MIYLITDCGCQDYGNCDGGEGDEEGRDVDVPNGALDVHTDGSRHVASRRNGVTSVIAGHWKTKVRQT